MKDRVFSKKGRIPGYQKSNIRIQSKITILRLSNIRPPPPLQRTVEIQLDFRDTLRSETVSFLLAFPVVIDVRVRSILPSECDAFRPFGSDATRREETRGDARRRDGYIKRERAFSRVPLSRYTRGKPDYFGARLFLERPKNPQHSRHAVRRPVAPEPQVNTRRRASCSCSCSPRTGTRTRAGRAIIIAPGRRAASVARKKST